MKNDIDFKVDYKDLMADFGKLKVTVQNRAIESGLRKSARVILNQVKQNFQSVKKNKSKTNYANFNKLLRIQSIRNRAKNGIGVKLGFTRAGYKYRWINWGTNARTTEKRKHNTGLVNQTNFFYNAVKQTEEQVFKSIEKNVIEQIRRVLKKNSM